MATAKPDVNTKWAEAGTILAPSVSKQQLGWIAEVPTFQNFNWILNRQDEFNAHVNENGIPEYDAVTDYPIDGITKEGAVLYRSLQTPNVGNLPSTSPAFWDDKVAGGGGILWTTQTGDFTAEAGNGYLFSGGVVTTVTMPASPADGEVIVVSDLSNSWALNNVTVDGNGTNIEGDANLVLDFDGAKVELIYSSTTAQWELSQGGSGPQSILEDQFAAGAGPFVLSQTPPSEESIDVYVGNVWQNKDAYVLTGDSLDFGAPITAELRVRHNGFALPVGTPAAGAVGTTELADNGVTYDKLAATLQAQVSSAWANFNGTGTIALRDSFNVSGLVDNGTGDYTVQYAVALADDDYAFAGTVGYTRDVDSVAILALNDTNPQTVSAVRVISVFPHTAILFDSADVMLIVHGGN